LVRNQFCLDTPLLKTSSLAEMESHRFCLIHNSLSLVKVYKPIYLPFQEEMDKACKEANAYDFIMKLPKVFFISFNIIERLFLVLAKNNFTLESKVMASDRGS